MRLGTTRTEGQKQKERGEKGENSPRSLARARARVFHAVLHVTALSASSLPTENNENIDPREKRRRIIPGRFPGPVPGYSRRRQPPASVSGSRAAFSARFFGRLLSKQTSRRRGGLRSSYVAGCHACARIIRPRVTILRPADAGDDGVVVVVF